MLKRLLMTGAAGGVGTAIRPLLPALTETVLLSDLTTMGDLQPHESFQACDLGDRNAMDRLVAGIAAFVRAQLPGSR